MPTPVGYVTEIASYRQLVKDFGNALSFNGSSGIVTLGTANPFTGSFYFSGWINWKGLNGGFQTIFAKRDSYAADGLMFSMSLVDTTGLLAFDTVTSYVSFNYRFPVGKPTHMTWVHDTVNAKDYLYINGILTSTQNIATLGTKTDALISIGGTQSPVIDVFNGEIDEVCIGTSAPTYEEVIKMYAKYTYPSQWSYLKFDEGTGSTATDSSGNGNHGTITTASYVTSRVMSARTTVSNRLLIRDMGTSLRFNGVEFTTYNYVLKSSETAFNLPAYSVELWFKRGNLGNFSDTALYCEGRNGNATPLFRINIGINGQINIGARTDANNLVLNNTSVIRINDKNWHHVLWTDTNGSGNLYIDGVADTANWNYTRGTTTLDRTTVGIQPQNLTSRAFNGYIDNVCVYNRALTPTEAVNTYYNGMLYPSSNILWWKFDEGSGTTANDSSGNGNTGTITGATYSNDVVMKVRTAV